MAAAEQALLRFLQQLLISDPAFVRDAIAAMREKIDETARLAPESLEDDRKSLAKLQGEINNLVAIVADGTFESPAVKERLQGTELEAAERQRKIAEAERVLAMPVALPDDRWIQQQLRDLADLLKEYDLPRTASLLRQLFGKVMAHPIVAPGKQRGFAQLRFQVSSGALLQSVLGSRIPETILKLLVPTEGNQSGTSPLFTINLGQPTGPDYAAPRIVELRAEGKTWKEIAASTGASIGNAYNIWKRFIRSQGGDHPTA